MYQEEFQLHEIVDTKTILTVLGTLGGAFLGAYFASRYSTDQVTRQLQYQKDLQEERRMDNELKYSSTFVAQILNSQKFLFELETRLQNELSWETLEGMLIETNDVLETSLDEIKLANPIGTLSFEIYKNIFPCLTMIEHSKDNIEGFLNHYKNHEIVDQDHTRIIKDEIEKTLITLNEKIPEIKKEILREVRLRKVISKRLNNI